MALDGPYFDDGRQDPRARLGFILADDETNGSSGVGALEQAFVVIHEYIDALL